MIKEGGEKMCHTLKNNPLTSQDALTTEHSSFRFMVFIGITRIALFTCLTQ